MATHDPGGFGPSGFSFFWRGSEQRRQQAQPLETKKPALGRFFHPNGQRTESLRTGLSGPPRVPQMRLMSTHRNRGIHTCGERACPNAAIVGASLLAMVAQTPWTLRHPALSLTTLASKLAPTGGTVFGFRPCARHSPTTAAAHAAVRRDGSSAPIRRSPPPSAVPARPPGRGTSHNAHRSSLPGFPHADWN